MAKLFIAEKPSLAKAIYTEIGFKTKGDGCVHCKDGTIVTWCFGHMLEQASPDYYLPEEGRSFWREEDLPIFPKEWHLECRTDPKTKKTDAIVKKQLNAIKKLLASREIDTIVNAGDPDREGQLLVDEVLEHFGNRKPVLRFWASAIDPTSIRKALSSLQPNVRFEGMKLSALARSRADWLLGMNLSRGYTLAQPNIKGKKRMLIAVGRVQTPTLMMVAIRDRAIKDFKPVPYLNIFAQCQSQGQSFKAKWQPKDDQLGMNEDHTMLLDFDMGKSLMAKLKAFHEATVLSVESKKNQKSAPTPMSLADIQIKASSAFGFTAEQTLNLCQSLYEKHKCASYPRTDCGFLPESQFADAPKVLSAIAQTCPELASLVQKANPSLKSKAWNDSKVTAHHGIIPTTMIVNWSDFTAQEKAIYKLIAQHYLAQFFPNFEYLSTKCGLQIGDETFLAEGKVTLQEGWRAVMGNTKEEVDQGLPSMKEGDKIQVNDILGKEDQTKPPSAYTEGKLIEDMERVYKAFADFPQVRSKLKETNGIGTPATRASIIAELRRKGYLEEKGKKLHASTLGVQVLQKVSRKVSSAVLTAQWEEKLEMIEKGTMKLDVFIKDLEAFIVSELKAMKKSA